jgi:hypothetical protein
VILRCQEAARLISSDEDVEGGWLRRLGLSAHLLMCEKCRRYKAQINALGKAARELWTQPDDDAVARLRDRILDGDAGDER